MVIAALVAFAILLIAWIIAPSDIPAVMEPMVEPPTDQEAAALAA